MSDVILINFTPPLVVFNFLDFVCFGILRKLRKASSERNEKNNKAICDS